MHRARVAGEVLLDRDRVSDDDDLASVDKRLRGDSFADRVADQDQTSGRYSVTRSTSTYASPHFRSARVLSRCLVVTCVTPGMARRAIAASRIVSRRVRMDDVDALLADVCPQGSPGAPVVGEVHHSAVEPPESVLHVAHARHCADVPGRVACAETLDEPRAMRVMLESTKLFSR